MKRLLAPVHREVLGRVVGARALLGFDFDGTLAPIVADRSRAAMRAPTERLFAQVCQLYPCAVISGRSRADVAARLGEARVKYVVGNHGMEPGADLDQLEAAMVRALPLISAGLAGWRGVDIEDKRYSMAIHYRRSRRRWEARAEIQRIVAASPVPLRTVGGKLVVNVIPAGAPHKGDAIVALRGAERASSVLFVGDDVTDEDVFSLGEPGGLCTVRVGRARASAAQYYLRDQREIDDLLAELVGLRPGAAAG